VNWTPSIRADELTRGDVIVYEGRKLTVSGALTHRGMTAITADDQRFDWPGSKLVEVASAPGRMPTRDRPF
jgi:signal peptidase I